MGKYSQKLLEHTKKSATDAFKTASKRVIQETAEAMGDLIDNKIANRKTNVSKKVQQNNSEAVTNEHDKEISKERYISSEERHKIIEDLKLLYNSIIMEYQKIINMLDNTLN